MIFQSLISLYDRLGTDVPPYGFSVQDIGFVVTIDKSGNLVGQPEDLRTRVKADTYDFRISTTPYTNQVNVRSISAATTPNFMVDEAHYIFGMSGNSTKDVYHKSFKKFINEVCGKSQDEGVLAVRAFLAGWNPKDSVELRDWKEISGDQGKWVAFRLQGDSKFVHERSEVLKLWADFIAKKEFPRGVSFIDGEIHDLQPQYAQFKFGSGASLVSFNEVAYESYGKKKGENAPISVEAEFKSSSALKYLLRSKTQRIRIGDATTVFWAERASPVETFFGQVINPTVGDQAAAIKVQQFLETVRQGSLPVDIAEDKNIKFYILGLSLNKARLALRFWHVCSVSELMGRLWDHFSNLEMEHSDKDIQFPGVWHLLKETARETKDISPVLGGALTRSILTGARYPQNLYQGVIGRIRADGQVNYLRVSILRAVLQRNYNKEVSMSLDTERKDVAYLLGRLFAVLEKAQSDAIKVKATIKDRFFSAASATPASVFPRLIRLSQHHIEKAEYGYISDGRIADIIDHIESFPAHMNLQEQGIFAIAYYQQKNAIDREIKEASARKNAEKIEGGE
jgi:CRISPR-associated protein Csd1